MSRNFYIYIFHELKFNTEKGTILKKYQNQNLKFTS